MQRLVGGLRRDKLHRPRDGDTGVEDDGELAAHDDKRLVVQLLAADLHVEEAFALALDRGQLDDNAVLLLDAVNGVHFVEGLHHAGDLLPAVGHGDIFIGYQGLSLPFKGRCHAE